MKTLLFWLLITAGFLCQPVYAGQQVTVYNPAAYYKNVRIWNGGSFIETQRFVGFRAFVLYNGKEIPIVDDNWQDCLDTANKVAAILRNTK